MRISAIVVAIVAVIGLTNGFVHPDFVMEAGFRAWMAKFDKEYKDEAEFSTRFANYKANMALSAELNLEEGNLATFGETPYSDMSFDEFEGRFLGRIERTPEDVPQWVPNPDVMVAVPDAHDWTDHGLVNPVRDQGSCGSCWAFGATATMEAAIVKAGGDLQYVSTSDFVDCDTATGNAGCNGGFEWNAFQYALENGVVSEDSYPYVPKTRKCSRSDDMPVIATFSSRERGPNNDEEAMVQYCHETGVLSIGIYVNSSFMNYKGGILSKKCPDKIANHAVNIIGWGEEDGVPYWIIRNSWGDRWGENGNIRIMRGENLCGLAQDVVQIYV